MGRVIELRDIAPQPWKNGGGVTRELLREPAGDDWRLRISVAEIARDGPFSVFPGVRRWLVVLQGGGVELLWPGHKRVLQPGDAPTAFDGADAPDCRLLGGPSLDLNLMLRGPSRERGALRKARAGDAAPASASMSGGLVAFYDTAGQALHWPCDDAAARADGFWIVAPP